MLYSGKKKFALGATKKINILTPKKNSERNKKP